MFKSPKTRGNSFANTLITGTVLASAAVLAGPVMAQENASEIVVTGSSIRGAPPVGSNLISVTRADLLDTNAQTAQQLLKTVPAIVGLNSAGQGSFGSADGAGTNAPTIHGLGASASNSTLILVDGHRFPVSGLNHVLGDPNIIPPIAIERVEVLPDGASAVYGSDAVAGVVNFITRRKFDGVEANVQAGFGDAYTTYSAGVAAGKSWDTGYVTAAYGYSERSRLSYLSRPWINGNYQAQTGSATSNFNSINCTTATITSGSTAYSYPYTSSFANTQANRPCFTNAYADILPKESRHSVLMKASQELNDRLTVGVDTVFSDRRNITRNSRGSIATQTVVSAPTATLSANPFFTRPAGTTLTTESVSMSFDELLGPGAYTAAGEQTWYVDPHAEYKLNDSWTLSASMLFGHNTSFQTGFGSLCTSCAQQALNGGALSTPTGVSVPAITLTTANALDPFLPRATNRTSAATLARLIDSPNQQISRHQMQDYKLQLGGDLFAMPGGPVKVALGGEFTNYELTQDNQRSLNLGPASTGSQFTHLDYQRDVKSFFAEALFPLVGPEQAIPLMYKLDVNVSGRYDDYNDFGDTSNPKIGVNWSVINGLTLRGSYAKSFVAPALTSYGADGKGTTSETSFTNATLNFNVPIALYPTISSVPGIVCNATTCTGSGATINGIQLNGGNNDLVPQKGTTWAIGADLSPALIPGFRAGVTYWHNEIIGAVTAPTQAVGANVASLANIALQVFPAGMTAAQIAATQGNRPAGASLVGTSYFVYDFRQRNVLNLEVEGIDADAHYRFDTSFGSITAGGSISRKTKFDQSFGNAPSFDVLGTSGFNTTFPSIKTDVRADVGFDAGPISGNLFANYTGPFKYWGGSVITPLTRDANGNPNGGGDDVKSYTTFDAHLSYKFSSGGMLGDSEVYIDGNNILDKRPPYENVAAGYDAFEGNPIGRVISIGLRAKY